MRFFQLFFFASLLTATVHAQTDSLTVFHAQWETKKVAPGIRLKHHWFQNSLFGANQNINILEVKLNRKNRIDVGAEPQKLKPTSAFGAELGAIAALNGTFFDMKNGGSVDYIRLDGKVLHENRLSKNKTRSLHQKAAIVIDGADVGIVEWDGTENWEQKLQGEDVMVTGPLLVQNGQRLPLDTTDMYRVRHPRTAAVVKGKKLLLITVDGRNERAAGMSLYELADFLKWLGADEGINLDGGGSTTLWISGYPEGGIINYPSDNKKMMQSANFKPGMDLDNFSAGEKWDRSGERPVANVLLVRRKR